MKLRRKIAILLALLLLASLPLFATAIADIGDFSGGGDYGGGSSSDDCDGIGWLIYYAFRLGCVIGEIAEDAGCSHGQVIIFEILFFAGLIGLFALIVRVRGRKANRSTPDIRIPAPGFTTVQTDGGVFARVHALDPDFSEQDLLERLKNLYFRIVDCRQSRDLTPIRPYLSEELSKGMEAELAAFRNAHETERTERLAILDARLVGFAQQDGADVITARLMTRCVRYRQNEETGNVVFGSKDAEAFRTVTVELTRPTGTKTAPRAAGTTVKNCPYCGAPLSLNESNQCPYCDSVLPADRDEWIIRSIAEQ